MSHYLPAYAVKRSPRVQLNGTVGASIHSERGQNERAKLQTISLTGGLLEMQYALDAGDFVQIAFHTRAGAVQGMAEILPATQKFNTACLQPFRFIAMGDDDHRRLRMSVSSALDRILIDPATDRPKAAPGL